MTIEQVVTQLQQEVITLKAQVADQTGLAEAVRAISNLATAQVRRDTVSLVDVKGLGRPKKFVGKEEFSPQCWKKTEAFLAGVIKESKIMSEWSAEQVVKTARSRAFGNLSTNTPYCSRPLLCSSVEIFNSSRMISNAPWLRMCHSVREFGGLTRPHPSVHETFAFSGRTHVFFSLLACFLF